MKFSSEYIQHYFHEGPLRVLFLFSFVKQDGTRKNSDLPYTLQENWMRYKREEGKYTMTSLGMFFFFLFLISKLQNFDQLIYCIKKAF